MGTHVGLQNEADGRDSEREAEKEEKEGMRKGQKEKEGKWVKEGKRRRLLARGRGVVHTLVVRAYESLY